MYQAHIKKDNINEKVSINEFVTKFRLNKFKAYCLVCNSILNVTAESSPNTKTHFRHFRINSCPTIDANRLKYLELKYINYDVLQKDNLIIQVKENLSNIYKECQILCESSLYYSEFIELLKQASKKRIWEYKGMQIKHIPYALVTLKLKFDKYGNRESSFFFCFSSQEISNRIWIDFNNLDLALIKFDLLNKNIEKQIDVNSDYLKKDLNDKDKFNLKLAEMIKIIY